MTHNYPALPLIEAIISRLKSKPELTALVGQRIYEVVPDNPTMPFVSIGDESYTRDVHEHECFIEILVSVDGRSRKKEKKINNAIIEIFDYDDELEVDGFEVQEQGYIGCDSAAEDNGDSRLSIVNFRFLLNAEETF